MLGCRVWWFRGLGFRVELLQRLLLGSLVYLQKVSSFLEWATVTAQEHRSLAVTGYFKVT